MRQRAAALVCICMACCFLVTSGTPVRAQSTTPAPETPGEHPKDRYVAEMNNLLAELGEGLDRLTRRAELAGEGQRPLLVEARREFEQHAQELRKALAAVAAADPFAWEEQKPAGDAAAAALEAAYRKALSAME